MAETTADAQARDPSTASPDGSSSAPAGDRPTNGASQGAAAGTGQQEPSDASGETGGLPEIPPEFMEDSADSDASIAAPEPSTPVEISLEDLTAGGSGDPLFAAAAELEGVPLDPVVLEDRYEIHPESPLAEFDSPSARAYRVEDRLDGSRALFALMCIPGMPIRRREIAALAGNEFDGLLPLVDHGPIYWPLAGKQVYAVIYQRPLGGRVADTISELGNNDRARNDLVRKSIVAIRDALADLMRHGFLHRGIRPGNLFFLDAEKEHIVLGDAFTAPPGFDQPAAFETIERGCALPSGRGLGMPSDDAYAMGVTLAFMAIGRNPVRHLQPGELILAKIVDGSYATLVGRTPIAVDMREPLRGLLHDDPEQRWGLDDLAGWLAGRRVAPSQHKAKARAERGVKIAGHEYFELRTVAYAMAENPDAAAAAIRDGTLERWALRSLEDKDLASAISSSIAATDAHRGDSRGTDDFLVARTVMMLDPNGPVRYKRFAFMPDGFGSALAIEILRNATGRIQVEILTAELPQMWFDFQRAIVPGEATEARLFAQMRGFLQIQEPGYGLLRCLYELNPNLPCLSPLLANDYVIDLDELLPALDRASHEADTRGYPIDDHIAAFIAARYEGNLERHLASFGKTSEVEMTVGVLGILASLQASLGPPALYGLASWVGGLIGPAIRLYRSRARRRELESEIPRLVRDGSLPAILALLNNPEALSHDEIDFEEAKAEFLEADEEIARVEKNVLPSSEDNRRIGQQSAAVFAVVVAISVVAILLIV